jgi:hypothetical protein
MMSYSVPNFERLFTELLGELGLFQVSKTTGGKDHTSGFRVIAPDSSEFRLEVKEYKRITPSTAESACLALMRSGEENGHEPVLFAAVVSDRTAEIALKYGVSWMDYAGNCRLVFPSQRIYVRRSGIDNPFGKQLPKLLNVFSSKSSRVVRAMLHEPLHDWQLKELAKHPDVQISPGLMSRIKRSLVDEDYAEMVDGKLRLKRPDDLLDDWVKHYRSHKPLEYNFYMRGELEQVEQHVANWSSNTNTLCAPSRFSAAWRLAPEVRYNVASFMVSRDASLDESLTELTSNYGARQVETGANLVLQICDDESYLSHRLGESLQTTSPLQTYLDLSAMNGRSEEAAMAIYEKFLKQPFKEATERARGQNEGN